MAPRRQTLDGMVGQGARVRARTYADSYAPRPPSTGLMNDVTPLHNHKFQTVIKDTELKAVEKAKMLVLEQKPQPVAQISPVKVTKLPQVKNQVIRPVYYHANQIDVSPTLDTPADIGAIVKDIQRIEDARCDLDPLESSRFYIRLRTTVQNMFVSRKSMVMSAMSMLLLIGGVVALASAFTTNRVVGSQVKALSDKASESVNESLGASDSDSGVPSEEKVPESVVNSYAPPADEPRYIYIPKIKNAKTRVLKMSVGKDNAVQTPRTTWDTGWYEGSSKPGDKVGSSLIIGHVSGLTGGGVFYNLYRLVDGDEIIVEMGDGTKYTYKVVSKEEVPLDGINMNNYLVSKNIDKPGLTIMTCAGEYNPVTQTYENRLAVFAVREN